MKTIKNNLKLIALIMSLIMLFQSCKAYYNDSVTLHQASQEFKRTKIQNKDNVILKFRGIKMEDNQYYGVNKVKGDMIKIPIDENFIKSVKLENETMSTILTIALPVTIVIGALAIIASSLSDWGPSFNY